ncbi:Zn-ribbon domain-containing OB-fold protein [Halorubrum gandharaense]
MSDSNAPVDPDAPQEAGYDEWLDALAAGEGYYLESPEGHGSLPPRRVCPHSGSTELTEEPLPDVGAVATYTVVHVAPPDYSAEAPYVTAVVDFGPVRLTGVLRGVEPDDAEIPVGLEVEASVEKRKTDGERVVVFRPA